MRWASRNCRGTQQKDWYQLQHSYCLQRTCQGKNFCVKFSSRLIFVGQATCMWLFFVALITCHSQIFMCLIFVGQATHKNLSAMKISLSTPFTQCILPFMDQPMYNCTSPTLINRHRMMQRLTVMCRGHFPTSDSNFQINIFNYLNMQCQQIQQ